MERRGVEVVRTPDVASGSRPMTWFVAWAAVGALGGLAILGAMTIGIFLAPLIVVGVVLLVRRPGASSGVSGLVSGAGAPVLYVAYLNRSGPGTVCRAVAAGGTSCTDEWSPWPWLAIGVVLVAAGVVIFVGRSGRSGQRER